MFCKAYRGGARGGSPKPKHCKTCDANITSNEARDSLGFDMIEGQDELRIPANIAGSAANPEEGGKPPQTEEETDGE